MLNYTRRVDWTSRWSEFIQDTHDLGASLTFDWKSMNCLQFVSQGIEAITGHDLYEEEGWTGTISNADSAITEIKRREFSTYSDYIASLFQEIPLAFIWPGDILLIRVEPTEDMSRTAIVTMPMGTALANPPYYYAVAPNGVGRGDMFTKAVRGFAVGHEVTL